MMLSAGNGFIMQSDKYSRDNAGQSIKKYILLKQGELAYNHGASKAKHFGCCYELTEPEARIPYVYHCFKINDAEYTPYVALALNNAKMDRQLKRLVSSSVRMDGLLNISFEDYMSVTLYLPSYMEQKRTADFLKKLDERIALQERLLLSIKKYKRGVVKTIFERKNQWEKYKISDIAHITTGHSNTQDKVEDGLYPFFIRSQAVAKSNRYLFDGEAVLTIGDGQIGKVFHYYVGKFDCHQRVYMLTRFKKTTGKYFYHYFSSFFYDRVIRMSAKNTVDSVRYDMIAEMPIYIPSQEQQQHIVQVLDLLDARITAAEQLLAAYEKEKNGLLQKMFI